MITILTVISIAAVMWLFEQAWPNSGLVETPNWYSRAFIFNSLQALIAYGGSFLWDALFAQYQLFSLQPHSMAIQVLTGYLVITLVYYWWHRMRHQIPLLWRYLHQLHHSPRRIEVITSFYKHPGEILANALLSSAILHLLLGLSAPAVGVCVMITGLAELVYHMNIRTPRCMGYFFQRPEMHRIHHQRGLHHFNYSDLPLWDMLFGTYRNPVRVDNQTGFPADNETRVWEMLAGKELES